MYATNFTHTIYYILYTIYYANIKYYYQYFQLKLNIRKCKYKCKEWDGQ